jgi:hypothetical protein
MQQRVTAVWPLPGSVGLSGQTRGIETCPENTTPRQRGFRGAGDEPGSRVQFRGVRLRSRDIFIGYSLFEVPSNLIPARTGARLWIARIMITCGLITAGMMFIRGPLSFYTSLSARTPGGPVLSGHDPLPERMVPVRDAGAGDCPAHDCHSNFRDHWRTGVSFPSRVLMAG